MKKVNKPKNIDKKLKKKPTFVLDIMKEILEAEIELAKKGEKNARI